MSTTYVRMTGAFKVTDQAVSLGGDKVGFRPSYVKIWNEDDGSSLEWFDSMGDDTGMLVDSSGTVTALSSDGLTPTATGFDLAAAIAGINDNASGEMCHFFASG